MEEKNQQNKPEQQLPEAPASATVKVKSPNGFEYLFTMRDESTKNLLFKMRSMEAHWMEFGWTPIAQNQYGKPKAQSQELGNCSKCGAPNKLSSKGKEYCSKLCWKNEIPVRQVNEDRYQGSGNLDF